MSKMNFKSTLWALAFACAAVSCSDELENGPNNNEGNEEQGGYYMTVNIATGGGSSLTKANGEGNEYLDETGKEDKVHDVNVFLIKSSNYSGTGTDDKDLLGLLNMDNATNVEIAGQGFTSIEDGLTPDGGTEPNHDKVEVKMQLTEPIPGTSSEKYQVFTVVNAGKKLENITTLASLRDFVYTSSSGNPVWTGAVASADKFVMSTHKMTGTPGNSEVILSAENMDASNPAVTNVYVERLAARIDLKVAGGLLSDAGLAPTGATIGKNGTFKLTGYTVVNRWNGDSYLFKQVSPTVSEWDGALPEEKATYGQDDPKKYLGNEKWERTGTTTKGSFNYVVEPQTRSKKDNNWLTTSYLNQFKADGNLNKITSENKEWVTNMSNINSSTFSKIAYTKENTMTVKMQKNGYSTGVIFESEFMPGDNFKVSKYSEGSITDEATLSGDKTFLVANHQKGTSTQKVVYADVKTIAAMAFDGIGTSMTEAMYKGFMDGTWPTTDPELTTIQGLIAQMKESNKVEAAFKEYLSGIANAKGVAWANVKDNLTYAKFLTTDTEGKKLAASVNADYIGTLFKEFGVSYYKGGKSYHKFWIRHDNNGNNNVMGVMEFCIVRNNVYQLEVTGVRDLGDPLPYTPGKDDPNNPDESGEVSILVNIYVKNWVVRSNGGIIL